ncbi:hypothetical protein EV175_004037, partial [Coemansia sp. RSA 1933]
MSMSPGSAETNRKRRTDGLTRPTTPAADASSINGGGSSRGTSAEPSEQQSTKPGSNVNKSSQTSAAATQLLRKISVAGVTVEVVRQESRIIYRLPGNMPVSSLTPEQRTKVMDEIQRMRTSGGGTTPTGGARSPSVSQSSKQSAPLVRVSGRPTADNQETVYSRPRPVLPSIAPRPMGAEGDNAPPPQSAPLLGSLASPDTPPSSGLSLQQQKRQAKQARPYSATTLNKPQQIQRSASPSPSPVASQKSALERMYQSAYLKLLGGPAEVLRKLSPPVELSTLLKNSSAGVSGGGDGTVAGPSALLQILKSLTKAQASQLANMYDRELRAGRSSLEVSTSGLRGMASQPQSRESSPVAGSTSGTESEWYADGLGGSGALTPTGKRKVGTMMKPLSKRRSASTSEPATGNTSPMRTEPQGGGPRPLSFAHADMTRLGPPPLAERRKRPSQIKREAEISKRFHEALAMDQLMVQNPDWRTPFSGTRDIVQRLLPFHVFQYPDAVIDSATRHAEGRISRSTGVLEKRLSKLSQRYNAIQEKEASVEGFYVVDDIQMEMNRLYAAASQYKQIEDAKADQCMSLAASSSSSDSHGNEQSDSRVAEGAVHGHQSLLHIRCGPNNDEVAASETAGHHGWQGKNMVEVEVNYNPDDMFDFKKELGSLASSNSNSGDSFEHPSAFARDIGNYEMSQGYGAAHSQESYNSPTATEMQYPTAALYANSYGNGGAYGKQSYQTQQAYGTQAAASGYQQMPYAAVVPDNMPLSQLIYSIQSAVRFAGQPPAYAANPAPAYSANPEP